MLATVTDLVAVEEPGFMHDNSAPARPRVATAALGLTTRRIPRANEEDSQPARQVGASVHQ